MDLFIRTVRADETGVTDHIWHFYQQRLRGVGRGLAVEVLVALPA